MNCRGRQRIDAAQRDCYYKSDFFPARWIVASAMVPGRVLFVHTIVFIDGHTSMA